MADDKVYTLLCIVDHKDDSDVFSVDVSHSANIMTLKDIIFQEGIAKTPHVLARHLTLWKVSMLSTPARMVKLTDLSSSANQYTFPLPNHWSIVYEWNEAPNSHNLPMS